MVVIKSAVLGLSSSLPPLVGVGGELECEWVVMADLLSNNFYGKQSRMSIDLPLTCYSSPITSHLAFKSREVMHLWLDLDHYGGTDSFCMFPLFRELIFWLPVSVKWFGGLFVWLVSRLAGNRLMSPKF